MKAKLNEFTLQGNVTRVNVNEIGTSIVLSSEQTDIFGFENELNENRSVIEKVVKGSKPFYDNKNIAGQTSGSFQYYISVPKEVRVCII